MPQPLAVLNDEEMHWLTTSVSLINGVGSIIVHSVTNTAERFPPPPRNIAYVATKGTKRHKKDPTNCLQLFLILCVLWLKTFVASRGLVCRRRPARFRGSFELSTIDQASPHTQRCARRVASLPARACSSGGVARLRCAVRRG